MRLVSRNESKTQKGFHSNIQMSSISSIPQSPYDEKSRIFANFEPQSNPAKPGQSNMSKVIDSPKFLEFVNANSGRPSMEKTA